MLTLIATLATLQTVKAPAGFHPASELGVAAYVSARTPAPGSYSPPPLDLVCFVWKEGKEITIKVWDPRSQKKLTDEEIAEQRKEMEAMPGKIEHDGVKGYYDERGTTPVEDGRLVTMDAGEWGGGVYLFSKDWKTLTQLFDGNASKIFSMSDGLYCFGGYDHMGMTDGYLLKIERIKDKWTVRKVKSYNHDLGFIAKADEKHFLTYDAGAIQSVDLEGKMTPIFKFPKDVGAPKTLQQDEKGTIYLGVGRFLLVLTPEGKSYRRTWFEPDPPAEPPLAVNSRPIYGLPANLRPRPF